MPTFAESSQEPGRSRQLTPRKFTKAISCGLLIASSGLLGVVPAVAADHGMSSARSQAGTIGTVEYGGKTFFTNEIPANVGTISVTPATPQADIESALASTGTNRVIYFSAGEYTLQTLQVGKSNTRIEVDPGATFTMTGTSKFMFDVRPQTGTQPISNVEIASTHPNHRFKVVVQGIPQTGDRRVVRLANVKNFAVSGMNIIGNYQAQPYIVLTNAAGNASPVIDGDKQPNDGLPAGKDYNPVFGSVASGGVIMNVSANKIHSGYATVQAFGANNVYMNNISGDEGVTVRLEPGSGGSRDTVSASGPELGALRDIVLDHITNTNGFAAVYLKAHAKINGNITLNDISAKDSGFAIHADSSEFSYTPPTTSGSNGTVPDGIIKRGWFESTRATGNITLTKTQGATDKAIFASSDLDYISPANRLEGATAYESYPLHEPSGRLRLTRTPIIPIILLSHEFKNDVGPTAVRGRWTINFDQATVTSIGFKNGLDQNRDGVIYREDGQNLAGEPLSSEEVRFNDSTNVVP